MIVIIQYVSSLRVIGFLKPEVKYPGQMLRGYEYV